MLQALDSMMGPTYSLLIYLSWMGLDLVLSVVWSFGVQLVVFFFLRYFSGIVSTLRFSGCHNTFLLSPHLWLIIGYIRDLLVPYVGWFIDGLGNLYADQTFWTTAEATSEGLDPVKRA